MSIRISAREFALRAGFDEHDDLQMISRFLRLMAMYEEVKHEEMEEDRVAYAREMSKPKK